MKKIISVLGTRPEIIKLSPLFSSMKGKIKNIIIHTGQHYDYEMDSIFFDELKLEKPRYNLKVGTSGSPIAQVSKMISSIGEIINLENPDMVLVQGDTNSVLAGALATKISNRFLVHIESGTRSFNREMREEINRIAVDSISDFLFVSDEIALSNLLKAGTPRNMIQVTGSLAIEASQRSKKLINIGRPFPEKYSLLTMHRAETTNSKRKLSEIIDALNSLSENLDLVFPIHPRTKKMLTHFNLNLSDNIKVIEPLGYIDFINAMINSEFVISDSGGVQEECAGLNVPCFIIREETEWITYVEAGKNILVGITYDDIISKLQPFVNNRNKLDKIRNKNLSIEKHASRIITNKIEELLEK
jgi:UDP-N-acetylglucosamine 2-epimerase (non-hydrolysing)